MLDKAELLNLDIPSCTPNLEPGSWIYWCMSVSTALAGMDGPKAVFNALGSANLQPTLGSLAGGEGKTQSHSTRPACVVSFGQCAGAGGPVYHAAALECLAGGISTPVYLTALLDYLPAEILELAGNATHVKLSRRLLASLFLLLL